MAEVHIIGQILKAVDFDEPHLYCKWSLQSGKYNKQLFKLNLTNLTFNRQRLAFDSG